MRKLLLGLTALLLFTGTLLAQKTVTGTVTDNNGNPLSGVSVVVVGKTATGTTTGIDGSYTLQIPADARQLQFSYIGFTTQVVTIGSKTTYSLTLVPESGGELEGVVLTGISKIGREKFTGAVSRISATDISNRPVGSFDQILQGRAPGVLATTTSGQPGQPTNIIIRGTNSIAGGSTPLYIVDGMPVEASVFQAINPNDFVSVDILRDAATLALYGSRGSAGVIVVTTKRGTAGKIKITYDGQYGVKSKPEYAFETMNTEQLLKAQYDYGSFLHNNSLATGGTGFPGNSNIPGWYYSADNPNRPTNSSTLLDSISRNQIDWMDYFFRQGNFSNHQVSISGGTGKTRVYTSAALYNEQGTTPRTDMKRATLRNNVDFADDKWTIQFSSQLGYVKRNFQQTTTTNNLGNPFLAVNVALPYSRLYDNNGDYLVGSGGGGRYTGANQLELTRVDRNYNDQAKATAGLNVSYRILDNLIASINSSIDFRETQGSAYSSRATKLRQPPITSAPQSNQGAQSESLTRFLTSNFRASLTYNKTIRDKHSIDVTGMWEYLQENQKDLSFTGYGIDPRTPNTPGAIQAVTNPANQLSMAAGGGKYAATLASGLINGSYSYNGKYTITGSFRTDGSSKLPTDNRWKNFFSVGAIWNLTDEAFISNSKIIDILRLRLSYGNSGNHNNFPSNYLWQATYAAGTSISGLPTQGVAYVGNPVADWEYTYITNLGIDFEVLNRRIYGDINLYNKLTRNLYVEKPLPVESNGTQAILVNAGELQNRGIEWNLNGDVIRNKNITWTVFATGGYNKNKLLSLGGEEPYESGTSFLQEGLPLGSHYEVKWGGVDAATGQPLYYDKDGKLTNVYSSDFAVTDFGTWESPWKGGFGTRLRYKDFELSALFSWQQGAYKMDNLEYFVENPIGFLGNGYNQSVDLKFWQKPGDVVSTPSPLYGTNFSSKLIHDASFLRFRDLILTYNVPGISKTKVISSLRVYVQATNLFIWTKWRGMDPEAGPLNINLSEYPNPRAITGGVSVSLF